MTRPPHRSGGRYWILAALTGTPGDDGEFLRDLPRLVSPNASFGNKVCIEIISGRKADAQKILHELQERSKKEFVPSYTIATIYTGLGQKEQALQHLTKAHEEGSYYMIHLKVEPILDPLRSDSRFTELMRKVGHVR